MAWLICRLPRRPSNMRVREYYCVFMQITFCFVFIIKDLLEMKFIYNNRFYEISHIFHDNFTNIKPLYAYIL